MARTRVLVVEDSVTVRRRLCDVLSADPQIEVVGEAADGKDAIERCRTLRPDVVTLDMALPVMSGLAATEYIMAHFPTPILIVSASTNRGDLFKTYDALAAGAVDVLDKPTGTEADDAWERKLVATVKLVARIRVITHPRTRRGAACGLPAVPAAASPGRPVRRRLLALGASTGGPAAVIDVLRVLPAPCPVPVLFVLHIGDPFGLAFAEWLDGQTAHRVSYARENEALSDVSGRVLMAPPGRHLVVRGQRLILTTGPERHSCRPSVDVLFESVALDCGAASVACLLTGMGNDGAAGLLAVRKAGGYTVAQDEATSVVYGMPREAVRLGAAEVVLPLSEIGPALAALVSAGPGNPS
jgi:two-component system, chemotaxis family, protein-glutamate methylesterase/glutaminase